VTDSAIAPLLALNIEIDVQTVLEGAGRIVLVLILALIAVRLIQRLVSPLLRVAIREQMTGEPEVDVTKRIDTLSSVIYHTTAILISIIAIVMILPEFGLNAGPLIAGIGLVGLAIGFGAQNLVRDVINGLELLIENQYGRGDFVKLGAVSGIVEDVNLRRTVLRDFDGVVHFVSHGQIDIASNYTRGYSRLRLSIAVPYGSDLDRVTEIIDSVGRDVAGDPVFATLLRQAPRAAGIERIGETTVEVGLTALTEPGEQWAVAGELRRRLKTAFDAADIQIRDGTPAVP
jgi:small conductance mechanosensitive channel